MADEPKQIVSSSPVMKILQTQAEGKRKNLCQLQRGTCVAPNQPHLDALHKLICEEFGFRLVESLVLGDVGEEVAPRDSTTKVSEPPDKPSN